MKFTRDHYPKRAKALNPNLFMRLASWVYRKEPFLLYIDGSPKTLWSHAWFGGLLTMVTK